MILSIDLGTSKLCAAVVDPGTGLALAVRSCANDTDVTGLADDLHEQDPVRTRDLCLDLIEQALRDPAVAGHEIDAIGISGQMHGVLLVDRDLQPLSNLITWRDRRTAREGGGSIGESLSLLDDGAGQRTGCKLAVGYGGASIRWLDRNDLLPSDSTALTIAGYVAASMTGVLSIDETHAASWGILDLTQNTWDEQCVAQLGIRKNVLPPIRLSGLPLGELTEDCRQRLGIQGRATVCSPVGDCQASVIGCSGFSPDTIVVNLGTGGQISVPGKLCLSTLLDAWPMPFGSFLQLGAVLCGGWSYAYLRGFLQDTVREMCGVELSDEEVYARMNELAASAESGAGGLTVDTRFSGTRQDESIKGSISGIDTTNLTPANLCLALLEGLVGELHSIYVTSSSPNARRLIASGNAVRRNPVLRDVISRTFGIPSFMSSLPEEATRGAAYAAAVGAGLASRVSITTAVQGFAEPMVIDHP